MANTNDAATPKKEPSSPLSISTSFKRSAKDIQKRRRLRRCKSAPQKAAPTIIPQVLTIFNKNKSYSPPSLLKHLRPSLKLIVLYLSIYITIGVVCFYIVRHQLKGKQTNGFIDSVYVTIITMTTVGYGDLTPDSTSTKLLACAFVFTGMALCGAILSKGADYLVEKQEALLVKALHLMSGSGNTSAIDTMNEIESKKVWYKLVLALSLLVLLIITGTVFLLCVEDLSLIDSFYCVVATVTTLGYGLPSFNSLGGRIFAIFWILMSTISVALFYLYLAEFSSERKQKELVKLVLRRRMTDLDLEAADLDNDGVVEAAEFVVYKLKELGKVTTEDVAAIMKEFEELDVDQSGYLSVSDITVAQSSPPHPPPPGAGSAGSASNGAVIK